MQTKPIGHNAKNAHKDNRSIIKQYTKDISTLQQTELFIQFNPLLPKRTKTILLPENALIGKCIRCNFQISTMKNDIKLQFGIKDYITQSLSIHIKVNSYRKDKESKLLEDIMRFDQFIKQRSINLNVNMSKKRLVYLLHISLSNNDDIEEKESMTPMPLHMMPIGIIDEGNTSYMDVIVQNMFWLKCIRKYVFDIKQPHEEEFAYYLQEVFCYLQAGSNDDNKPIRIDKMMNLLLKKRHLNIAKDPLEEFLSVIDAIDPKGLGISDLFRITMKTSKGKKVPYCQYISVNLLKDSGNDNDNDNETDDDKEEDSIQCLLERQYNKNSLSKLAKVLLVHLNRFNANDSDNDKKKDCSYVKYESTLSLEHLASSSIPVKETQYRLHSVIVHEGKRLSKGVFYSYIKSHSNNNNDYWYKLKGTKTSLAYDNEVYDQCYGGKYESYSFSSDKLISIEKDKDKTAYILIYINEYYIPELFPDFTIKEIPHSIIKRCQRSQIGKDEEKQKENEANTQSKHNDRSPRNRKRRMNKRSKHPSTNTITHGSNNEAKLKSYTQMRTSSHSNTDDLSLFNEVNDIYLNNILNNQETYTTYTDPHTINNNNNNNNTIINPNASSISIIQSCPHDNTQHSLLDNINESLHLSKIFNTFDSSTANSFNHNPNTSKHYIKLPFSINLIHNETNKVLQTIDFNDTPIDISTTSIMFLPLCHSKLPSNEYYDISLFKLVLLTNCGLYIKILNDLDEMSCYIQLHYRKKFVLCLYTIEMEILMQLNESKKLIAVNYNQGCNSNSNEMNYPVLISNTKLYTCPKSKWFKAIRQLIERYKPINTEEGQAMEGKEGNGKICQSAIYSIKNFGNTITEVIEKKTIDTEEVNKDESFYDMIHQCKVIRLMIK